jgi:hypothetical protein
MRGLSLGLGGLACVVALLVGTATPAVSQPSVLAFGQEGVRRVQLIEHRERRNGYAPRYTGRYYGRYDGPYYGPYAYYAPYYYPYQPYYGPTVSFSFGF